MLGLRSGRMDYLFSLMSAVFVYLNVALASDSPFVAAEWSVCGDYPQFQCRNATVPYCYEPQCWDEIGSAPNTSKTLSIFERRLVSGSPRRHFWMLQGGPGENSDVLSLTVARRLAKALGTDFIIQIPSQRGSAHTDRIPDYAEYPANLGAHFANQTSSPPVSVFTTTNIAHDLVASVEFEKTRSPAAEHLAYGVSFGTVWLNRAFQIEPDLFTTTIMDGVVSTMGFGLTIWRTWGINQVDIASTLASECARSPDCQSLSVGRITEFVQSLKSDQNNTCLDLFAQSLHLDGSRDQIHFSVARALEYAYLIPVPVEVFRQQPVDWTGLLPEVLGWYAGDRDGSRFLTVDPRVILWALLNHFAQCNPQSEPAFKKLLGDVFVPFMEYLSGFFETLDGTVGSSANIQADHIVFSDWDSTPWTSEMQRIFQNESILPYPDAELQIRDDTREAFAPYLSSPDKYSGKPATDVKSRIIMINGDLDPNTPFSWAKGAFEDVSVASNYTKTFYKIPHAGHAVLVVGWSICTDLLFQTYFVAGNKNVSTRSDELVKCLAAEEVRTLDWRLGDLEKATGFDIWQGLKRAT